MMGRRLSDQTLTRMRTLLFDHQLTPPLVARRLGLSERVVQGYRTQWQDQLQRTAADLLKDQIFHVEPD